MTDQAVEPEVGRARPRKEDARLITGQTNWTDNISVNGLLHMAILRSPMAHARIERIDVSPALDRPGVIAAFSGGDFAEVLGSLPCAWPVTEDIVLPDHPAVAVDEVRYAGDPVAVVVARDRYAAADALEAIEVDYEPLPPVLDLEAALAQDAPLVHSGKGTNRCYVWPLKTGEDFDSVRQRAEVTLKRRYHQQRLIPNAMEPRAVVVTPLAASGEYTLYSATQIPHIVRVMMAVVTGIPEHKLRVIAPDVGGGFGSKLQVYGEEAIALAVARRLGRPVKWTESRSEGYLATHHGRGMIQDVEIAANRDGTLLGLKVDLLADMGAYLMLVTPGIPILGAFMYPAIYKMGSYDFTCTGVFTTRTPTDAYRGAGRPEATFAIERVMDELAVELGLDPVELRRRNWIGHEEFPYTTIAGLTYDSGNYEAATEKALALFDYDKLRAEQADRNHRGDTVRLGIGVSTYTEMRARPEPGAAGPQVRGRRLGGGEHPGAADRQDRGGHRHQPARAGPCDLLEPDRRRRAGGAVRGRRSGARRHQGGPAGHGHLRVAVARRGRNRRPPCRAEGGREGAEGGRPSARSERERPGVHRRRVLRQGVSGRPQDHSGGRLRDVLLARSARRHGTHHQRRAPDRPGQLLLSARHPPVRGRSGHGDRADADPLLRQRRRRRQGREPDDRRGTGARRHRAGHRAGALRGGRVRRRRQPGHRHDGRLPRTGGARPARLRDGPDGDTGHLESPGRQGSRGGGHDRVHARRGQRGHGRTAAPGRARHTHALYTRAGLASGEEARR